MVRVWSAAVLIPFTLSDMAQFFLRFVINDFTHTVSNGTANFAQPRFLNKTRKVLFYFIIVRFVK